MRFMQHHGLAMDREQHHGKSGGETDEGALLRERQILQLIPVSRATFRRWLRSGMFPPGFRLCGQITVWRAQIVQAWIDEHDPNRRGQS